MSSSNPEKSKSEHERRERQDWGIVLLILLIGFLCVIVAGQRAMSFAPRWTLDANVESNIDLNSEFRTSQPAGYFEPLDPAILTQPGWVSVFLTPGAPIPVGTSVAVSGPTGTTAAEPTATPVATNTLAATYTSTAIPTNTLIWLPPPPATNTRRPPPANTPTNTSPPPPPQADLTITNTDNADFYIAGDVRTYTIVVSNLAGPSNVIGATVTNALSGPVAGATWSCVATGTVCGAGGLGGISDLVNLPVGSFIAYTVDVTASAAGGNLVNTASVTLPGGYIDPTLPNEAPDTDALFVVPGGPPGGLGTLGVPPGSGCSPLSAPSVTTFSVPIAIVDGDPIDLIYYEELQTIPPGVPGILMDKIIIEISDGLTWLEVVNWGDDAPNSNPYLPFPGSEPDNYPIDGVTLIDNSGIGIDIPDSFQNGPNTYIRITLLAEGPPDDGNVCIDAFIAYP
jgi:hypothetical protein